MKAKENKKKKKTKKWKINYPKGQFLFNVISLTVLLLIALYIGGRSIYYFSKQNEKIKVEANTLATNVLKHNDVVESGDGLYQVQNEYVFKGKEVSNYVKYSNRLWHIMRINEDHSVQLVADHNQTIMIWGDDTSYETSNIYQWLNPRENVEHTGIFYYSLNDPEKYLNPTPWCEAVMKDGKFECKKDHTVDYVSILMPNDYVEALGQNSYLADGTYSWLLGLDEEKGNLYLSENGAISPSDSSYVGYGIKPVVTIKNTIDITGGDGSESNPYTIETTENTGKVGQYVKLGEDLWQVYEENDTMLYLSLNQYLMESGEEVEVAFADDTVAFDLEDRGNIAYYLNNRFLNQLSYQDVLSECTFYTGEISDETGYDYLNIYQEQIRAKVGLLDMVSLKMNQQLEDYFLINKTSSLGEMAFIHRRDGRLYENLITEEKKIVPTVCLLKEKITNGNGNMDTPYIVE